MPEPIKRLLKLTLLFLFFVFHFSLKAELCHDFLLLDGFEPLISSGMDTSYHWWAVTQPFTGKYRMIIDGEKSKSYNYLTEPVFSPNGERWAYFAVDASNQTYLITEASVQPVPGFQPGMIIYSPNSEVLAYTYYEQDLETFVLGDKSIKFLNRMGNIYLSQDGSRYSVVGMRGSSYVMNINGRESSAFDRILPIGFWIDGQMCYSGSSGDRTQIYKEFIPISDIYRTITDVKINLFGTVMAAIAQELSGRYVSLLFSDDYVEPMISKQYEYMNNLVLHPSLPLIGLYAFHDGINVVMQNSTEYSAGAATGNPHYTHDGSELYFLGCDIDCFLNVNGLKYPLKTTWPSTQIIAKQPKSKTIAFTTSSSLVLRDLEDRQLYSGMMADTISYPRYNWRQERYETLGQIRSRLYLMTCAK
ncbi:MAG: hypothetical protein NT007_18265 [Candidatus Kapabacteria bacterium]|nr:hypothetical protein [Candidatus Kapabacteria bacterium]